MAEWAPFEANEHVIGASLRIIEVISTGTRQADCRYRIAFDCCGAQKEVSHRAIRGRIEGLNKGCMKSGGSPGRTARGDAWAYKDGVGDQGAEAQGENMSGGYFDYS